MKRFPIKQLHILQWRDCSISFHFYLPLNIVLKYLFLWNNWKGADKPVTTSHDKPNLSDRTAPSTERKIESPFHLSLKLKTGQHSYTFKIEVSFPSVCSSFLPNWRVERCCSCNFSLAWYSSQAYFCDKCSHAKKMLPSCFLPNERQEEYLWTILLDKNAVLLWGKVSCILLENKVGICTTSSILCEGLATAQWQDALWKKLLNWTCLQELSNGTTSWKLGHTPVCPFPFSLLHRLNLNRSLAKWTTFGIL